MSRSGFVSSSSVMAFSTLWAVLTWAPSEVSNERGNFFETWNACDLRLGRRRRMATLGRFHDCRSNRTRKTDCEGTALSEAFTLGGNRAAVKIHDVLDDGQSQAHSALSIVGGPGLPEAIENIFERALVESMTVVGDDNFEMRIDALEADLHLAAFGRELDRVGQEIPHRLLKPLRIAHDYVRARIEDDLHRN